ncbi:hypothetical protein Leryth_025706 [Lithospermum erythrorhizon]|nr:hypothetical protein Leryth_025706 [Lithospermum erythrorhizon]
MEFNLRLAVGLMADVASLLLYVAPILTFVKVVKKKSSDGYSCVPYILALYNSSLYTWYGLPIVSLGWENFLLVAINSIGILFEISFISIFFNYATSAGRSPNCIGSPLGILQLMLYCKYMKRGTMKEPQKWDMESANVNKRENLHQEHKVVESIDEMKHIQHLKVVIDEEKIHDGKI